MMSQTQHTNKIADSTLRRERGTDGGETIYKDGARLGDDRNRLDVTVLHIS